MESSNLFPLQVEDVDYLILDYLDPKSLRSIFLVNKYINKLLDNSFFWRKKIERIYGFDIGITTSADSLVSPKQLYYKFVNQREEDYLTEVAIKCCCIPAIEHYFPKFHRNYGYFSYEIAQSLIPAMFHDKTSVIVTVFDLMKEEIFKRRLMQHLGLILSPNEAKMIIIVKNINLFNPDSRQLIFYGAMLHLSYGISGKEMYDIWVQEPGLFKEWFSYAAEIRLCGLDKLIKCLSDDELSSLIDGNIVTSIGLVQTIECAITVKRIISMIPADLRQKYSYALLLSDQNKLAASY